MYFQGNESSIWNLNVEQFEERTCEKYKKMTLYGVKEISPTMFLLKWTTKKRSQCCTLQPSIG